ncbi:hypothetical protein AN958_12150 [Leucoagaricus sp. SymC.cos]|nr:hypothetical protein AN958_12150 [Leucoagaricus sp. SymC.cos]
MINYGPFAAGTCHNLAAETLMEHSSELGSPFITDLISLLPLGHSNNSSGELLAECTWTKDKSLSRVQNVYCHRFILSFVLPYKHQQENVPGQTVRLKLP